MTSGFKIADGTDLDDLFYIDNGNAGALGFLYSSGTDLGNAYTNKSVLGYNVGFLNSAGTDLGFLRGNVTGPTGCTVENDKITTGRSITSHENYDDEYTYAQYSGSFTFDSNVTSIDVAATWYNRTGSEAANSLYYRISTVYSQYPFTDYNMRTTMGTPATQSININGRTFKLYITGTVTSFINWIGSFSFTLTAYDSTGSYTYQSPTYDFESGVYSSGSTGGDGG